MTPVTDPDVLAQLNGGAVAARKPVTDPALLAQLEDASTVDRAQAAASGVNRGALVNLAGLPVATALNAYDLAKAGAGAVMGAFGAKPENLPEMTDRSQFVGSPEWISKQLEEHGAGGAINPNRPEDAPSRYLHAGGQGVAGAIAAPSALPQALASAATGAGTMMANEYAGEHGASPATQALISTVLPAATSAAATGLAQRARAGQAAGASEFAQGAQTRKTVQEAQDAGYAFPPAQVNPGIVNKVAGGLSGKAATEQAVSLQNQPVTNAIARNALGLHPDTPLSYEVLANVRKEAGNSYDAVKGYNGLITADEGYLNDLIDMHTKYQERLGMGAGEDAVESLKLPAVKSLLDDMTRQRFTPTSAIELIKRFRSDADSSYRAGNNEAGGYQKSIAKALEDLVGRNLDAGGQPELLANFQQARQRIAQAHTVEDALNPATGNVDATKLAEAYRNDEPLTGGLRTAAQAAGYAPMSMRDFKQTPPGVSALDAGLAAAGGLAFGSHGFAVGAALPIARMAARKLVTSSPWQRYMAAPPTSYKPSVLNRSLAGLDLPSEAALPLSTLLLQQQPRGL